MALPNGYEYADMVFRNLGDATSSPYFDLGFVASSSINIDVIFRAGGDYKYYIFGARETNSTSSAKQLNLYQGGQSAATYIGYASARVSLGNDAFSGNEIAFQKEGNEFTVNNGNVAIEEVTGATTTFTGTKNLFLFALNNAGNPSFGTEAGQLSFYCFRVYSGDSLIHEFLPVYDTINNEQCLYDSVTDSIIQKSGSGDWTYIAPTNITHYLLTLENTEGGYSYIRTRTNMEVTKLYCRNTGSFFVSPAISSSSWSKKVVAYEKNGYSFVGWEKDGQIVSTDREITVGINANTTLKAVFAEKSSDDPKNKNYLMCFNYGTYSLIDQKDTVFSFAQVQTADIKMDGVSKTNSTIEVDKVPDGVMVNSIVAMRSPRGKTMYIGVVKSIVDNVLTCREPISLFDADFLFGSTKTSKVAFMYKLYDYMRIFASGGSSYAYDGTTTERNRSVERMMNNAQVMVVSHVVSIDNAQNMNITMPVIDSANVSNLEDYLLKAFDDFGIYIDSYLTDNNGIRLSLVVTNPKIQEPLVLSDNSEALTDVVVDVQEMENTSLVVYDSTGATFRGIYSVKLDGTITNYNYNIANNTFVAHNSCKPKVVMTDDKIKTVVEQYLSNAKYNHKITFNLDLDSDLYSLDALNIGRRVEFYYKNKVYQSIVTGLEWNLPANTEDPHSVKVTLGKVRNKLTTKINLGKIKK